MLPKHTENRPGTMGCLKNQSNCLFLLIRVIYIVKNARNTSVFLRFFPRNHLALAKYPVTLLFFKQALISGAVFVIAAVPCIINDTFLCGTIIKFTFIFELFLFVDNDIDIIDTIDL